MSHQEVDLYIRGKVGSPFFYVVDEEDYLPAFEEFKQQGFDILRMSDFCSQEDKFPDTDDVIDSFRTTDLDYKRNKCVLIGLGEYLLLRGEAEIKNELCRFKSASIGGARVILLLRGVADEVKAIVSDDVKMKSEGRVYFSKQYPSTQLSITQVKPNVGSTNCKGVKGLLRALEDGDCGCEFVSELSFDYSLIPIDVVESAYDELRRSMQEFQLRTIPRALGTDDQWSQLLSCLQNSGGTLNDFFNQCGLTENVESKICNLIGGEEFERWLLFLYLKLNSSEIRSDYLRRVVDCTDTFDCLKDNVLTFILNLDYEEPAFMHMYDSRKTLVEDFSEADAAYYISQTASKQEAEMHYLTDNTEVEKQRIILWISEYGWSDSVKDVYPALASYLEPFPFRCDSLSQELMDYFQQYKKQKVENKLEQEFLSLVIKYADSKRCMQLQSRDEVFGNIVSDGSNYLYWVDALGVEYVAYIASLARKNGLSISVEIARAEVPTVTEFNKDFYDGWGDENHFSDKKLDDVKHNDRADYYAKKSNGKPIHIAEELEIIDDVVDIAAAKLAAHECQTFIIASDHGASRLAVLADKKKYPTKTKGEHSGRCCKAFTDCNIEHLIEGNDYFSLTDYGVFEGGRSAKVEVHGGATLEEIVVPIIKLELEKRGKTKIIVYDENQLQADRCNGTTVRLYISEINDPNDVSISIDNKRYQAIPEQPDNYQYRVELADIKHAKSCTAVVYDGDNKLGSIVLNITGKSGTINEDFDSEFEDLDL